MSRSGLASGRFPVPAKRGQGNFSVQQGVLGQIDPFLAAFSQETLNFVAVVREEGGLAWLFCGGI